MLRRRRAPLESRSWRRAVGCIRGSWPVGFPRGGQVLYSLEEIVTWERAVPVAFFSQQFQAQPLLTAKVMAGVPCPRASWHFALQDIRRGLGRQAARPWGLVD